MQTKSNGVIIFGVILLCFAITMLFDFLGDFVNQMRMSGFEPAVEMLLGARFKWLLLSTLIFLLGLGILQLSNTARIACIIGSFLFLIWGGIVAVWNPLSWDLDSTKLGLVCMIYPNIVSIPIILYLTRRKVKAPFKEKKIKNRKTKIL